MINNTGPISNNYPPSVEQVITEYSYVIPDNLEQFTDKHFQTALDKIDVLTNGTVRTIYPTLTPIKKDYVFKALARTFMYYFTLNSNFVRGSYSTSQGANSVSQTFEYPQTLDPDIYNLLSLAGFTNLTLTNAIGSREQLGYLSDNPYLETTNQQPVSWSQARATFLYGDHLKSSNGTITVTRTQEPDGVNYDIDTIPIGDIIDDRSLKQNPANLKIYADGVIDSSQDYLYTGQAINTDITTNKTNITANKTKTDSNYKSIEANKSLATNNQTKINDNIASIKVLTTNQNKKLQKENLIAGTGINITDASTGNDVTISATGTSPVIKVAKYEVDMKYSNNAVIGPPTTINQTIDKIINATFILNITNKDPIGLFRYPVMREGDNVLTSDNNYFYDKDGNTRNLYFNYLYDSKSFVFYDDANILINNTDTFKGELEIRYFD